MAVTTEYAFSLANGKANASIPDDYFFIKRQYRIAAQQKEKQSANDEENPQTKEEEGVEEVIQSPDDLKLKGEVFEGVTFYRFVLANNSEDNMLISINISSANNLRFPQAQFPTIIQPGVSKNIMVSHVYDPTKPVTDIKFEWKCSVTEEKPYLTATSTQSKIVNPITEIKQSAEAQTGYIENETGEISQMDDPVSTYDGPIGPVPGIPEDWNI
jgi:hypothetical protein